MESSLLKPMDEELSEYLRDESRVIGAAESISFPKSQQEVITIINELYSKGIPITVQGTRTGLAAGAVPKGGHIMNLSRMDSMTAMRSDEEGHFHITLQAGMILSQLRKQIEGRKFDVEKWSVESRKTLVKFREAPEQFFSPDPTEGSATIGGMVACNASGARSYLYGSIRKHITALKIVLYNGHTLSIQRGNVFANGRTLNLVTDQGYGFTVLLPSYEMPKTKNASGYYIEKDMDAIDLFIGSDGTLGVITDIEIKLLPLPQIMWGVSCFFEKEKDAIEFVIALRERLDDVASMEFFDGDSLELLRKQKNENPAFSKLPVVEKRMNTAIYIELHCENEKLAIENLTNVGLLMRESGGCEKDTWVARNDADRDSLLFFRHAVPESVNMLIDERKKEDPIITKLGTDMSVPNHHLRHIVGMYRSMLNEHGLQSAIWGHIGDNHLHVNILPHNEGDYIKGKALYAEWATEVSKLGGAVSAEHGVGKLKANFLTVMYGQNHIDEMAELKETFDPKGILGTGNMFTPQKEVVVYENCRMHKTSTID
ncbi:D-lactate dehydrogenase (cytochrome) [Alkaliphilus metalliredigens QYMF]|uniref:D-lactate dehydrogenase (cytochrome) n=1 Tax=Alkaliphilus metalliredigens (strain QYMF) TaxID=293826 RepID=A6TLC1_ALKMQ|nr:FAD-binding oxidoreductase [Alkaliphilus metalliredigens]ABR46989.1 D-lactate dehydrogenase (cytochrome) [Alkaliphilus metalliredigens QYMF]